MKVKHGSKPYLYPMPTVLVGTVVDGRVNFEALAWCGILEGSPALISIASGKSHYSNAGIKANGTFSVNIPSTDLLVPTDYCGITSGRKVDKSGVFRVFYGDLKTAPMIEECPVCLECRVSRQIDVGGHDVFVGEIVEAYIEEDVLTDGKPDIAKIDPLIYSHFQGSYWKIGQSLGPAFKAGKAYRTRE
jgi:flavin reductase (DIM6/NTAB) family NADH-FMN oxidoreductase RutF